MKNKTFNMKNMLLSGCVICLVACEGRREFPSLVETGVKIDEEMVLVVSGDTEDLAPRFEPNIPPQRDYTWTIEDPSIADLQMNGDQSVSITGKEAGETVLSIMAQDGGDNLTAETRLKVIASAPVDITDDGELSVRKENNGGPTAGEGSPKVVDGDLNTKYLADYLKPFWMTLKFSEKKVASFYELTSGNDAPDRDPLDWQILGSNDGENWEVLDERTGVSFPSRNMTSQFYFDNDTGYNYYRLDILNNNGGGLFQMSEWRLLAIPE